MKNNYLKKIMLIFPALFLIMSCIVPVKAYASTCPHAGSVSISTIKATCTKKGKKVVKCSRCGKVLSTQRAECSFESLQPNHYPRRSHLQTFIHTLWATVFVQNVHRMFICT